ncbi:zinc carboxypeptidase family protein (macronuclear) [Tetrahymena thermophila SB210]|uniref:Cytosolic carboxypeptidase-like protein 5 n=1 Tax=Tetrahymena thermophila (strain SB210) TaxID=312017 RepID=Q239B1_TETTS|nr:zinc carboxypeptidase family protein [Tetrahymena thermophila SB210]EAR93059.2 zinc carboxypeptidase family protein [Tetrahymena thermophila SB210]|eukprot:XP_001013304.2 zinc carboxypeptidase family protein [Tetrahymena thermophila SB210]
MQCKQNIPQHNEYIFTLSNERQVKFSSNFDSGNCGNVVMLSNTEFEIDTSPDFDLTSQTEGWSKSWFYFSVTGLNCKAKFNILRLKMLYNLWSNANINSYRPVFRVGEEGEFSRFKGPINLVYDEKDNVLKLTFQFDFSTTQDQNVYFSFSYPYSYQRNIEFIDQLANQYSNDPDIYFNREILTYTPQLRLINLLTISSHDDKLPQKESYISDALFPERDFEQRAVRFKPNKPIVLISARVHPGETPASFALEGFLKFLLNKNDLRAVLLRKYFTFWVVPMLNPDGVYCGHYRMDIYNQNLNRFYQVANNSKQPSIYAMKKIICQLSLEGRLFFYMDFHSHAGKKGTFLYGNAIEEFSQQVENQVFAKIMAINDPHFEYNYCNFSKAQMKSKDRQDDLTKEGCGRVFVYQTSRIVHSYTLECGFHHATQLNPIAPCSNGEFKVNIEGKEYKLDENDKNLTLQNFQIQNGEGGVNYFTPQMFEESGKAVLISLLDVYEKNPYSRIANTSYSNIENIRKETAAEVARSDRIRQEDAQSYSKAKNIINLINENFFSKIEQMRIFNLKENIDWPLNIKDSMTKKYTGFNLPVQNTSPQNKFKKNIQNRGPLINASKVQRHKQNNNSISGSTGINNLGGNCQLAQSFDVDNNFIPCRRNQSQHEETSQSSNLIKTQVEPQFEQLQGINQNILSVGSKKNVYVTPANNLSNISSTILSGKEYMQNKSPTEQGYQQRSPVDTKKGGQNNYQKGNVVIVMGQSSNQKQSDQQNVNQQQQYLNRVQSKRQRCLTDVDNQNYNGQIQQLSLYPTKIPSFSPTIYNNNNNSPQDPEQRQKLLQLINQKQSNTLSIQQQIPIQQPTKNQNLLSLNNTFSVSTQQNFIPDSKILNDYQNFNTNYNEPSILYENSQQSTFNEDSKKMLIDQKNQTSFQQQNSSQQRSPTKNYSQMRQRGSQSLYQDSLNVLNDQINQVKQQVASSYYQENNPIFGNEKATKTTSTTVTQATIREFIQHEIQLIHQQQNQQIDINRINSKRKNNCKSQNDKNQPPHSDGVLQIKQHEKTVSSTSSNSSNSNGDVSSNIPTEYFDKYFQSSQNNYQFQEETDNKKIFNQVVIRAGKSKQALLDKEEYNKYMEKLQNYFNSMSIKQKIIESEVIQNQNLRSPNQLLNTSDFPAFQNHRNSATPQMISEKQINSQNAISSQVERSKQRTKNHSQENESRNLINRQHRFNSIKQVNCLQQTLNLAGNYQQQNSGSQLQQQVKSLSNTQPNEKLTKKEQTQEDFQELPANKKENSNQQKNNEIVVNIADMSDSQVDDFSKRINFLGSNFKSALSSSKNNTNVKGNSQVDRSFDSNYKSGLNFLNYTNNIINQITQSEIKMQSDLFRTRNQSSVSPPIKYRQAQTKYQIAKQTLKIPCPSINEVDQLNNASFVTPYNKNAINNNIKLQAQAKTSGKTKQQIAIGQSNLSPEKFSLSGINQMNKIFKLPNLKNKQKNEKI